MTPELFTKKDKDQNNSGDKSNNDSNAEQNKKSLKVIDSINEREELKVDNLNPNPS